MLVLSIIAIAVLAIYFGKKVNAKLEKMRRERVMRLYFNKRTNA